MINLVYYSPELRVHRDGSVERYYKTKKEWKKINNKPNLKGYLMINIDYEDIRISRLIAFCYLGLSSLKHTIEEIDHIDRNRINNNVDNLRIVSHQHNLWNKEYKGYCYRPNRNKYFSRIAVNGKQINIGYFKTEEEARKAYLTAKAKYHII